MRERTVMRQRMVKFKFKGLRLFKFKFKGGSALCMYATLRYGLVSARHKEFDESNGSELRVEGII